MNAIPACTLKGCYNRISQKREDHISWVCVHDPSGYWKDKYFSRYDMIYGSYLDNWVEGTIFENRRNGNKMLVRRNLQKKGSRLVLAKED